MIYSYVPKKVGTGITGYTINPDFDEDVQRLCDVDGKVYVYSEKKLTLKDFPKEILFKKEEITPELKDMLKASRFAFIEKEALRNTLTDEVGDFQDLLADAFKLIEFNILLTSRLAADYLGTSEMSPEVKANYSARNQLFLDQVDSGELTMRADFEDADEMLGKVMGRYSKIQSIVKDKYVDKLKEIGIW